MKSSWGPNSTQPQVPDLK
uniref:Uncharacterized protein n=1 Tax=Anguilla anguilla TaxID=7936 RepID=A0A0E9TKK6_ANGAN